MTDAHRLAREIAAKTAGVVSTRAARSVGLHGRLLARRLRDGEWSAPTPRVLVLSGSPSSFERDAWIGLYDAGKDAALSHDTLLALCNVPGFERYPIHVSCPRGRTTSDLDGVTVHHPRLWRADHRMLLNDIPVVTPTRALFDLANDGHVHTRRLERAINNAWARRLTSGELLKMMADDWCERGRRGSAFFHEYLATRPVDWQPPESNLEGRFVELIVGAGLPEPKRQRNLGDNVSWIGRIDMVDPEVPLVGEIDSDLFHTAPLDLESDSIRDERLSAAGFVVERFTEFEVWHRPAVVIERWRAARVGARRPKP
ncbi:MAG: hypothetical protein QOK28_864 [Actinomycetota bacterium]